WMPSTGVVLAASGSLSATEASSSLAVRSSLLTMSSLVSPTDIAGQPTDQVAKFTEADGPLGFDGRRLHSTQPLAREPLPEGGVERQERQGRAFGLGEVGELGVVHGHVDDPFVLVHLRDHADVGETHPTGPQVHRDTRRVGYGGVGIGVLPDGGAGGSGGRPHVGGGAELGGLRAAGPEAGV